MTPHVDKSQPAFQTTQKSILKLMGVRDQDFQDILAG
jgi:hypothetical protein